MFLVEKPIPEKSELAVEHVLTLPKGWGEGLKDKQSSAVSTSIKQWTSTLLIYVMYGMMKPALRFNFAFVLRSI